MQQYVSSTFHKILHSIRRMDHFKLLIIGAGASGIAAASKLLENGFGDFKILEAENRIGGRIHSTTLGEDYIELGAEWIHGEVNNAVYELASKNDLTDSNPSFLKFENTRFYELSGSLVDAEVSTALAEIYFEIIGTSGKSLDSNVLKGSLGDFFKVEFENRINELRKKYNISDSLQEKFLKTFENFENSIDGSDSWYETSLSGHLEYWECDGNGLTEWKNRQYKTVFGLLTKKIPHPEEELPVEDKIIFSKEVINIIWNKECTSDVPNVTVMCSDGSTFSADHVLITSSLGVLKERALKMFTPLLSDQKFSCIENLGFGTVDKIFVKFSQQWWGDDTDGFGFLWSDEERRIDSSGWLNGIICFHPISTTSSVLRGWIVGDAARIMESLTDREVTQGLNYLFNKFMGSQFQIPPLEVCLMSKWYSNPHFRGSYSCRLLKSESSNVWASQLAEPVCNIEGKPILFFGGEATHDHYFSTVHGAIETGRREANRILPFVTEKYYEVIIVGAGICGLAAAKTLLENGISRIKILEAQSEPGGRIRSLRVGEYCLELGAQWIHGSKNDVFLTCQQNNLLSDEFSAEGEGLYLRENGETIDEEIVKEVDDRIKDILENCENYILCQSKNEVPHSIGQELVIKFNEYLDSCIEDTEEVKQMKKDLLDWHVRYQLIDNSCSDLDNLSARAWGLFKFCGGSDYVNLKNGYSTLIDLLVNSLPKNMISYESSVDRIEWKEELNTKKVIDFDCNSNYSAKIKCNNGENYFSQYVIVTSSLGYLKSNYKSMFAPSLPNYLAEAIEFLDFGVIDKIFLIYSKQWWEPNVRGFQLVWSDQESEESFKHWGRYVTGFDAIIKDKPILLGWIGGEGAKIVEEMPEEQVGRESTEILRYFTKNPNIPLPVKVIRSTWWNNEYVKGAYSHITVKCDDSDISCSSLAQPVYSTVHTEKGTFMKPTILLAGESTHKSHYSTVHGAYESGQSQAQVILEHITNQNSSSGFEQKVQ